MPDSCSKSSSRTVVYVGGFGPQKLEEKLNVLENNLRLLSNQMKNPLDVIVNCYHQGSNRKLEELFKKLRVGRIIQESWVHCVPGGVLAGMWITNPYNKNVLNYNQVVMILDDVSIQHLQLVEFEQEKTANKLDIISACVTNSSHPKLMEMQEGESVKLNSSAEMFLYLMDPVAFQKYISIQKPGNPWIWGVDFLLKHIGFSVGISSKCKCYHMFSNLDRNNATKQRDMIRYLDSFYPSLKKKVLDGIHHESKCA